MDNNVELIKRLFDTSRLTEEAGPIFDESNFIKFLINILNIDREDRLNVPERRVNYPIYRDYIYSYKDIVKYTDENKRTIIGTIVKLNNGKSPEKSRNLQRNFIAQHIEDTKADAAIVALYSDSEKVWRISFVKTEQKFTPKGLETEVTPAKRYSYLIEPNSINHTAQSQFQQLIIEYNKKLNVEQIEKAFSVEVITEEFFEQYKQKYIELKTILKKDEGFGIEACRLRIDTDKFADEFSKKLMGQISFLYFLQKKGWLGVKIVPIEMTMEEFDPIYNQYSNNEEIQNILKKVYAFKDGKFKLGGASLKELSQSEANKLAGVFGNNDKYDKQWGSGTKKFIRELFEKSKKDKNFFNDYLEPLFYNALNKERDQYSYFHKFNCKVPFLNGGLFEPISDYDWENIHINISNEVFSNEQGNGILDFFDTYNFTMSEDEPLEKEVAVDPEMLGKIFESLLDVEERKSKGAFYTPREIVHYMCQECLIKHINNETQIDIPSLELLVKYGDIIKDADIRTIKEEDYKMPSVIVQNIDKIDGILSTVTVADPSVGSGAFPLGMLNEIVKVRSILTEYMTKRKIDEDKYFFKKSRNLYNLKKEAMQNSIFAVDIESSAVDITKLRLWLSLVVDADEKIVNQLPNLDHHIMVGNSLVDEFKGIELFDEKILNKSIEKSKPKEISNQIAISFGENGDLEIGIEHEQKILNDIQYLQNLLFDTKNSEEKEKIKYKIQEQELELIKYKLLKENKLKEFEKIKKEKSKPYFLWKLWFSDKFMHKGGFDIIIGNPPYVGERGNKDKFRIIAQTKFGKKFYNAKMDLFYFFFHKALDLCKEGGTISYITTNYFFTGEGAKKLRLDLKERSSIFRVVNLNDLRVFESAMGQHNAITFLQKKKDLNIEAEIITTNKSGKVCDSDIVNILSKLDESVIVEYKSQQDIYEGEENIISLSNDKDTIIDKMINKGKFFINKEEVGNGIDILQESVTDKHIKVIPDLIKGEGIFAIDNEELERLDLLDLEKKIIKPYYTSKQVSKFKVTEKNEKWILYTDKNVNSNIDNYPNIKKHLDRFEQIITSDNKPYGLHRAREERMFRGEKILCLRMTKEPSFTYTSEDTYVTRAYLSIKTNRIDLKYLVGILNSKLVYYWLYNKGKRKGKQLQVDKQPLLNIPICIGSKYQQEEIISVVSDIISTGVSGSKYNKLIKDLDKKIYSLYDLTNEEIDKISQFDGSK